MSVEIKGLEAAINGYEKSRKSADKFIALVEKYENFDTLTNVMLNELVEKILVHERDRKGSVETTQKEKRILRRVSAFFIRLKIMLIRSGTL